MTRRATMVTGCWQWGQARVAVGSRGREPRPAAARRCGRAVAGDAGWDGEGRASSRVWSLGVSVLLGHSLGDRELGAALAARSPAEQVGEGERDGVDAGLASRVIEHARRPLQVGRCGSAKR